MRKALAVVVALLTLPAFLFIYQPAWQLGGIGLLLGGIGMTLTPLAILIASGYLVYNEWKR